MSKCPSDKKTREKQGILGGLLTALSLFMFAKGGGPGLLVGTTAGNASSSWTNGAISGTGAQDALDAENNLCMNINNTIDAIDFFNELTKGAIHCQEDNEEVKQEIEDLSDALILGKNDLGKRKKKCYMKLSIFAIQMLVTIMIAYYFMSTHKVKVNVG
jgi:hypothetical protein